MAFAAAVRALIHRNVFVCAGTCRMHTNDVHRCGRAPSFQRVPARATERYQDGWHSFMAPHSRQGPSPFSLVRVVPCVGTAQHVNTLPKSCSLPISGLRPRLTSHSLMGASCVASCSHTWWSNADADGRREPSVCMHVHELDKRRREAVIRQRRRRALGGRGRGGPRR